MGPAGSGALADVGSHLTYIAELFGGPVAGIASGLAALATTGERADWVLVLADDGDHLIVHDPWVEDERGEAKVDAAAIPVPHEVFYGMAQFGRMRAAIVLGEGSRQ